MDRIFPADLIRRIVEISGVLRRLIPREQRCAVGWHGIRGEVDQSRRVLRTVCPADETVTLHDRVGRRLVKRKLFTKHGVADRGQRRAVTVVEDKIGARTVIKQVLVCDYFILIRRSKPPPSHLQRGVCNFAHAVDIFQAKGRAVAESALRVLFASHIGDAVVYDIVHAVGFSGGGIAAERLKHIVEGNGISALKPLRAYGVRTAGGRNHTLG